MYERRLRVDDGPATGDLWAYQPYTDGTVFGTPEGIDADVSWIKPRSDERIGYPTQKPLGLLRRIIEASSKKGDVVLDPFCGCGTAVHAAQELERDWIGIDITHIAIEVIETRLRRYFGPNTHKVYGRPEDAEGARHLANRDKYQFQFWAVSMIKGQARGGYEKKGADGGIDGEVFFKRGAEKNGKAIVSVKGGKNVTPSMVRDLIGTRATEKADAAVFICLDRTPELERQAKKDESFETEFGRFPRCQVLGVEQLFDKHPLDLPLILATDTAIEGEEKKSRPRKPKKVSPEELRKAPQMPLPIPGGKAAKAQPPLPLAEPLLVQPQPKKGRGRVA